MRQNAESENAGADPRARPVRAARELEAPCAVAAIVSVGVAACLIAVVWATYAAFDLQVFDLQQAVWHATPHTAPPSAVGKTQDTDTVVVIGPRGPGPAVR